jgi:hypothetical protein
MRKESAAAEATGKIISNRVMKYIFLEEMEYMQRKNTQNIKQQRCVDVDVVWVDKWKRFTCVKISNC